MIPDDDRPVGVVNWMKARTGGSDTTEQRDEQDVAKHGACVPKRTAIHAHQPLSGAHTIVKCEPHSMMRGRYLVGRSGLTWMKSSSSCFFDTGVGHSVMRSEPFCVFGNAITSRM